MPSTEISSKPLFIEAIFPTVDSAQGITPSNESSKPLFIEAIFPTEGCDNPLNTGGKYCSKPLFIEAIFPTNRLSALLNEVAGLVDG